MSRIEAARDLTACEFETLADLRAMDNEEPMFIRVLTVLHRSPTTLSGRRVAVRVYVSPTTAIKCLEDLAELGAVVKVREGRANVWRLTPPAARFLADRAR